MIYRAGEQTSHPNVTAGWPLPFPQRVRLLKTNEEVTITERCNIEGHSLGSLGVDKQRKLIVFTMDEPQEVLGRATEEQLIPPATK